MRDAESVDGIRVDPTRTLLGHRENGSVAIEGDLRRSRTDAAQRRRRARERGELSIRADGKSSDVVGAADLTTGVEHVEDVVMRGDADWIAPARPDFVGERQSLRSECE